MVLVKYDSAVSSDANRFNGFTDIALWDNNNIKGSYIWSICASSGLYIFSNNHLVLYYL
jgi:hypothetical protein